MPRTCVLVTGLVMSLVLALGGCQSSGSDADAGSGDGPDADPAASVPAWRRSSPVTTPEPGRTPRGTCFAEELTASRSPRSSCGRPGCSTRRTTSSTSLPPLPEDVAGDWADAQLACADFVEASTRAQVKVTKGDLDGEAYAACLRQKLTDDEIRAAVAASLSGDFDAAEVSALSTAQAARSSRSPDHARRRQGGHPEQRSTVRPAHCRGRRQGGPLGRADRSRERRPPSPLARSRHGRGAPAVLASRVDPRPPHPEAACGTGGHRVHPDHPGQVHATGRAPCDGGHVARGDGADGRRLARRHLRVHRRRPVRRCHPVRVARSRDAELRTPRAGRVGRADDGAAGRPRSSTTTATTSR